MGSPKYISMQNCLENVLTIGSHENILSIDAFRYIPSNKMLFLIDPMCLYVFF